MKKFLAPVLGLVLLIGLPLTSNASIITWGGTCLDCAASPSPASAFLEVSALGNVAGGTDIGYGNLLSFSYFSEYFPFGVFASGYDITAATGIIPAGIGVFANVSIDFIPHYGYEEGGVGCIECVISWRFETSTDGIWSLSSLESPQDLFDFGNGGAFNVPEPATILLMGLGLAGLGWRKRQLSV